MIGFICLCLISGLPGEGGVFQFLFGMIRFGYKEFTNGQVVLFAMNILRIIYLCYLRVKISLWAKILLLLLGIIARTAFL